MQPFSDKTTVGVPVDERRADQLALVLDRYMREMEAAGIPPDVELLAAQHPDLAGELRSYAESLQLLHQMTAGLRPPAPTRPESATSGMAPKRLGDYDLIREIGRGGMGIVYEARQLSLNRQVALKVLPFAAMLDDKQIARFRNEAQAAAQLHHPNIVPVHAVGQERGVHFFAMQYVSGQSLEAALEQLRNDAGAPVRSAPGETVATPEASAARLAETATLGAYSTRASTRSRGYCQSVARLMVQAADAIQHAHEYGVIHRDVKPSNLLLDRGGKLWVTDFGLARMQSDSGVTITGDVVGTLRYMSPEQAAGATAMIDARSDVYSLGATLYELLTLRPAHMGDNRQEVLKHIETREPTPPRMLNQAIPPDLETITLRAMAKSREERYQSAKDFADDLRLFLEGRPTVARRPTLLDRANKWALRHRRAVSAAAGFLLVLAVVSISAALMIAREKNRTDDALGAAQTSLANAERSDKLAREMLDRLGSGVASELATVTGSESVRRRLLGDTLRYYRQFIDQSANDPRLQKDLAAACFKAASIAELLGNRQDAIGLCRQALTEFDELVEAAPRDASMALERSKCHASLGFLLAGAGELEAALAAYETAITQQHGLAARPGADVAAFRALAETYSNSGLLRAQMGQRDAAQQSLKSAIGQLERLADRAPEDRSLRHDLAISHNSLSFVEREIDWALAEESSHRAVALLEKLADEHESVAAYRADLAICHNNLGAILAHRKSWKEASDAYRSAIELQEQLVRQAPAVVGYRRELAASWSNLGHAFQSQGDPAKAAEAYEAAEKIVTLLVDDYPDDASFQSLCGAVHNNRAMALEAAGDLEAALHAYRQAIERQRVAFLGAPGVADYQEFLSKHYFNYGRALRAAGKPGQAREAALARRGLWPGDGDRLGQVAVELAQTAISARALASRQDRGALADRLEADVAETLREAAAAGLDLAALRDREAFRLLQDPAIAAILDSHGAEQADRVE